MPKKNQGERTTHKTFEKWTKDILTTVTMLGVAAVGTSCASNKSEAGAPTPEASTTQIELSPTEKFLAAGDKLTKEEMDAQWSHNDILAYACEKSKQAEIEQAYSANLMSIGADHRPAQTYPISAAENPEHASDAAIISSINHKFQTAYVTNTPTGEYSPDMGEKMLKCVADTANGSSPFLTDKHKQFNAFRNHPEAHTGTSIEWPILESTNPDDTAISPNYPESPNGKSASSDRLMRDIHVIRDPKSPTYSHGVFLDVVLDKYTIPGDPTNTVYEEWVAKI